MSMEIYEGMRNEEVVKGQRGGGTPTKKKK
jgi:hypothetical protein